MSAAATQNVTNPSITDDAGQPDFQPVLVIDRFDHWHNQPAAQLRPTSITWSDPATTVGRVA